VKRRRSEVERGKERIPSESLHEIGSLSKIFILNLQLYFTFSKQISPTQSGSGLAIVLILVTTLTQVAVEGQLFARKFLMMHGKFTKKEGNFNDDFDITIVIQGQFSVLVGGLPVCFIS